MRWLTWTILAGTLLIVVLVGGLANPFTAWNAAPVLVAMGATWWADRRPPEPERAAAYGFSALATGPVLLVHLAWWSDWAGTATGSSTSGLIFAVLPLLALGTGLVGLVAGRAIGKRTMT